MRNDDATDDATDDTWAFNLRASTTRRRGRSQKGAPVGGGQGEGGPAQLGIDRDNASREWPHSERSETRRRRRGLQVTQVRLERSALHRTAGPRSSPAAARRGWEPAAARTHHL